MKLGKLYLIAVLVGTLAVIGCRIEFTP